MEPKETAVHQGTMYVDLLRRVSFSSQFMQSFDEQQIADGKNQNHKVYVFRGEQISSRQPLVTAGVLRCKRRDADCECEPGRSCRLLEPPTEEDRAQHDEPDTGVRFYKHCGVAMLRDVCGDTHEYCDREPCKCKEHDEVVENEQLFHAELLE